jgi:hypothetical protein
MRRHRPSLASGARLGPILVIPRLAEPVMPATIDKLQTETQSNEDLRGIENRLDNLSNLLDPETQSLSKYDCSDRLTLGNYRLEIANVIDQAMAETKIWWTPDCC